MSAPKRWLGSALLEVALAMAVMATCGLGLMRTQLALGRHAQAAAHRERAAFVAASIAEAALEAAPEPGDQWKAKAAAVVPDGLVAVSPAGAEASLATVTWTGAAYGPAPEHGALPLGCGGDAVAADRNCLALAFAR